MTETDTSEQLVEPTQQLAISPRQEDGDKSEEHDSDQPDQQQDDSATPNGSSSVNLEMLHPLENEWTMWYDRRPAAGKRLKGELENYENNLRPIGSFATVEDFWRYYNHLVKPSKIELNANYHLFKKGIKPMWEDPGNMKGGKWVLLLRGGDKNLSDVVWENVVLGLIGETLDSEDEICGAVMSRRKAGDRIAVWNKNRENETAVLTVGRKLKSLFGLDPNKVQVSYQSHEDSLKTGASYSNPARYKI